MLILYHARCLKSKTDLPLQATELAIVVDVWAEELHGSKQPRSVLQQHTYSCDYFSYALDTSK